MPECGPIRRPKRGVKTLIANCPTTLVALNAADITEAETRIHCPNVKRWANFEDDVVPTRPFIIVTENELCSWVLDTNTDRANGDLIVTFEFPCDLTELGVAIDDPQALDKFEELVENIILEMSVRAGDKMPDGVNWFWNITRFEKVVSPALMTYSENPEAAEDGEAFYAAAYKVSWI